MSETINNWIERTQQAVLANRNFKQSLCLCVVVGYFMAMSNLVTSSELVSHHFAAVCVIILELNQSCLFTYLVLGLVGINDFGTNILIASYVKGVFILSDSFALHYPTEAKSTIYTRALIGAILFPILVGLGNIPAILLFQNINN